MNTSKNPVGRPRVVTEEIIAKLEYAFAIDATVEEACAFAEISRDAFYDHVKREPEFSDRIAELRQRPILKARHTIVQALNHPVHAQWYLQKKRKDEFAERPGDKPPNGVFSMSDLRRKMKESSINIIHNDENI